MGSEMPSLPRDKFEIISMTPIELDAMAAELTISFQDIDGLCEIKTCYGDIRKIVDALMDYSRMLEMVCDQWNLHGFHRVTYEYHAEKLRAIARKYQAGIHYDYDAAVEKCQKRQSKQQRDDDPGGDALELAFLKEQREQAKSEEKAAQREQSSGQ